jgi:hypothetical protein
MNNGTVGVCEWRGNGWWVSPPGFEGCTSPKMTANWNSYVGPCPSPAELQNLKALAIEAADEIEACVNAEYGNPPHPALKHRYERDMDIVYRLRAAAGRSREKPDLAKQDGELL